jgi:biopolymer transport protein ExbD
MAFIPSHIKKHNMGAGKVKVNLTSMMDIFTNILLFLLVNYATEGMLIQPSEDIRLPKSTTQKSPEIGLDLVISKEWILVNNDPVIKVKDIINQKSFYIIPLQEKLNVFAREAKKMEELYGTKFSGKVTIQGDVTIPYKLLVKVMATCGKSDYPNMRLVVYQTEQG